MMNIKALFSTAALMACLAGPALAQSDITFAGVGSDPTKWTGTSSSGLFNINGGSTVPGVGADAFLTTFEIYDPAGDTLLTENVYVQFNGGAGVATSGVTHSGSNYSFTLSSALTVSYEFATPTNILGSYVTDLLSVTFAAGTTVTDTAGFLDFSASGVSNVFTSDLFRFVGSTDQEAAFITSHVTVSTSGATTTLTSNESGNFSADPYPNIPEAPSAVLLVVGMAAVAVGARRRKVA